jgi:hypothetical protein
MNPNIAVSIVEATFWIILFAAVFIMGVTMISDWPEGH